MNPLFAAILAIPLLNACATPENVAETPRYLAQMQAAQLDHYVSAGDFRLHYLKIGQGDPVVLLPGGGAWIYDMRELAQTLAQSHTVFVIDPPGDGYTTAILPHPDFRRIYTLDAVDRSLLEFMNQLGISRAAFVGNSWGGGYALYFAERHPDRVTKYVSLDGTGLNLDDTGGSLIWKFAKVPVVGEIVFKLGSGRSDVRKYLTDTLIHAPVTDDMVTEYYLPYRIHANLVSQWTFERNLDWLQTERLLPRLIAPTLIVWGRQDKTLLPELYLPRWKALKPNARIEAIDQAGHLVHVDQPGQVAKVILQFLDS